MSTARPINTVQRFFAHAIAIEHEAAERYREFAEHMSDSAPDTAALFERLAHDGFNHARQLLRRANAFRLPQLRAGAHAWLDNGTPLAAAHEWVFRLLSPRDALKVAMHAEQRAKRFFAHVIETTREKGVRELAESFLKEEGEHIARMKRALLKLPNPIIDWERIYAHGGPAKTARAASAAVPGKKKGGKPARRASSGSKKAAPAKRATKGSNRPARKKSAKKARPVRGTPSRATGKQAAKKKRR